MSQVVEINLRLPSLRMKATPDAEAKVINNSEVRFTKSIELNTIPKPGEMLTLTASGGLTFACEVTQATWHESKNMFVIACKYAKHQVPAADYLAILNATDWTTKSLLDG